MAEPRETLADSHADTHTDPNADPNADPNSIALCDGFSGRAGCCDFADSSGDLIAPLTWRSPNPHRRLPRFQFAR